MDVLEHQGPAVDPQQQTLLFGGESSVRVPAEELGLDTGSRNGAAVDDSKLAIAAAPGVKAASDRFLARAGLSF